MISMNGDAHPEMGWENITTHQKNIATTRKSAIRLNECDFFFFHVKSRVEPMIDKYFTTNVEYYSNWREHVYV
jgi:hypothetical protein